MCWLICGSAADFGCLGPVERGSAIHGVLGLQLIKISSQNGFGTAGERKKERENE